MSMNARDKANAGRVRITYDVETGDASPKRELPFVVGVLGDFAGDRKMPPLSDRRFVDIDRRNFDTVLGSVAPTLSLNVDNVLTRQNDPAAAAPSSTMQVDLVFRKMDDFSPERIAEQVPAIKLLTETRARLRELLTKANRSEDLAALLKTILTDNAKLEAVSAALKPEAGTQ
jgi:type VI secretion system protein ImpB